jgi:hypothetical protein
MVCCSYLSLKGDQLMKRDQLIFQPSKVLLKGDSYKGRSCSNFLDGLHLDACNCVSQLTGDLLFVVGV